MRDFITKKRIYSISGVLFLFIIWKIISLISASDQIMPSPELVVSESMKLLVDKDFLPALGMTIGRGFVGFSISIILAFLIGFPSGINENFFHFINPLLVTLRSTPVISLILLAIIWLGNELVPVFIAILTMFPIICINIIDGIKSVDHDLINMGKSYQIRKVRIYKGIYLPAITPFLTGGISNALGFGWRAIIIGEVLSQPEFGIGKSMQEARSFLLVSELIAWTLVAILVSYLFEMLVRKIEKRLVKWR